MPEQLDDAFKAADRVIELTGGDIRLGLPLGLGKPNRLVNALYRRAQDDASIRLDIYTALSLGRPAAGSDLERRFLEPFADRVFGDYEELDYLHALRKDQLPDNVRVFEFFFQPGSLLRSESAQRRYISVNYTHAARDINARGVNVVAQMLAVEGEGDVRRYSFACNPEVTLELLPMLKARRDAGETIVAVGQVHHDLPFMGNDAELGRWYDEMDIVIDDPKAQTRLFSTPNMPVSLQDHFVGLHASALVRDGGTLQIGIGALGDALVHHTRRREQYNQDYRRLLDALELPEAHRELIGREGGDRPFELGLYGCSEMMTHGLLRLIDDGIIRRPVYDWKALQAECLKHANCVPGLELIDGLRRRRGIRSPLPPEHLKRLTDFGVLRRGITVEGNRLRLPNDDSVPNDLDHPDTREALETWRGDSLNGGIIMHGGFFLGPAAFYQRLRELDAELRGKINMTRVNQINDLYGGEELRVLQRRDARFVNTAFTVTLLGAAVSDQLDDGRVLSGVGGQYNFVSQAHELPGARSILMTRAWRERGGEAASNVLFSYAHNTIPRHLRDIVITEYGIADLRGKTDEEVVMAMLNVADSRFQVELMEQAQQAGKLRHDYRIPERFRHNNPDFLRRLKAEAGADAFPDFPLGTDFDATEQRLLKGLTWLKETVSQKDYLKLAREALLHDHDADAHADELKRMGLHEPEGIRERLYQRLLLTALDANRG
ncbi:acetyl-CoA hydrolase/transferase family protein [Alcanivorax sp. 521-1]|uniref:Acetyl-CoA hydrolase/transferase family protein n=1 Tax=Alloalcanivorax profundimaris TaxID=2735259 RepID=A0ABS0AUG8_9GAMM|nr:acetyl-CoA hydrolase/transferase family protein [Alloalcanivorax profundimaris]MBF5057784.1 acetyl-CoA hydrolase/transferase family protein [Alloalcanivorax profundimaris]